MIGKRGQRWPATRASTSDSVGTAVLGAGPAGLTAGYALALRGRSGIVYEADGGVGGIAKTLRRGDYHFDLGGHVFSTHRAPVQRLWEGLLGDELVRRPCRAGLYGSGGYTPYPPKARWVEDCYYPRLGPGQMWDALRDVIVRSGIPVRVDHRCVALHHSGGSVNSVVLRSGGNHLESRVEGVLSTIPLPDLMTCLCPTPPTDILRAATQLRYRSMRVVVLMTGEPEPFPDNWIYLHDGNARATRIQNFGAWSSDMVPPGSNCLGVEFDCALGDEIWETDDAGAVKLATHELTRIGLIDPEHLVDGVTVRVKHAYPIRDQPCVEALDVIRGYLETFHNLQTFGRNGLHQDNTQDHSVWSAMLAAGNLLDAASYDVWTIDAEAERTDPGGLTEALPGDGGIVAEAAV